ncbi:MAG: hypothetical protein ACR2HT_03480 [Pyrinomonadaceae bacterium]
MKTKDAPRFFSRCAQANRFPFGFRRVEQFNGREAKQLSCYRVVC